MPKLADNQPFLESLRRARAHQVPVYAEGCGLQYLARSLRTSDGETHQMAGLIPIDIALEAGTLHSGYRDLSIATPSMLGAVGTRLRGHEFHFSRLTSGGDCLNPAYTMHDCDGEPLGCEGWTEGADQQGDRRVPRYDDPNHSGGLCVGAVPLSWGDLGRDTGVGQGLGCAVAKRRAG